MYVVTGGAGFIGSAFVAKLNAEGIDDIIVVDELGSSEKWNNLVNKRYSDYLDKEEFRTRIAQDSLPEGIKAIIHMGACSSTTERNASYMMENNYRYTRVLSEWALNKNIRFIYASSAATYGSLTGEFPDDDETVKTLRPLNIYGYSKHLFDLWALRTGAANKMAGLKFFNVFGPNEYHKEDMRSVVEKAFHQIQETGKVKLFKSYLEGYADGEQKRDFVYVKDCTDIMWWLLENPDVNGIYNVGTGTARTWKDLVTAVFSAMGKETNIEYIDMPQELQGKYQYFTQAKMDKLRSAGYNAAPTSLEEAVADYVQNYLLAEDSIW